jgi:hypothetical protein
MGVQDTELMKSLFDDSLNKLRELINGLTAVNDLILGWGCL